MTRADWIRVAPGIAIYLIMLWLSPATAIACAVLAVGLWVWTKHPAQAAVLAAMAYPAGVWLIDHPGPVWVLVAAALGGLLAWLHRADI